MNSLFKHYNKLGFFNPYYLKSSNKYKVITNFQEISKFSKKELDIVGVAQILNFGFILGNRTLIKDINKTPWMAKLNETESSWDFFNVPLHQENTYSDDIIYKEFFLRLKEELKEYIANKNRIGILLTGGMDSRIVASVLLNVIKENELYNIKVQAFTWGDIQSRDVVYAKQIAELYNWNWEHLTIDAEQLKRNVDLTIENGCEFSPIHLHAMPKVFDKENLDCVLAGSFGDSVGRAEYSGVKVTDIKPFQNGMKNRLSMLNNKIFDNANRGTRNDLENYHKLFPREKQYQQLELDYQLHYMRRMLNPCMNVINKKIPVHQMFTSPAVYGYIWSLHPSLRTDKIYYNILKNYSPELLEIPWARTGLPFPKVKGVPDNFNNKAIDYGALIREYFIDSIEKKLVNGSLVNSNVLSFKKIKILIKLIKTKPIKDSYFFEDKLIWLYSLQLFIDRNELKLEAYPSTFSSNYQLHKEYFLRLFFYKYRKQIKSIINKL